MSSSPHRRPDWFDSADDDLYLSLALSNEARQSSLFGFDYKSLTSSFAWPEVLTRRL